MKDRISKWITKQMAVAWLVSYVIVMLSLWASVFTYNEVVEAREQKELLLNKEEWIETPAEQIWKYTDILVDRESTDENWNYKVWDEIKFRSFTEVDISIITPDLLLEILYLDKFLCKGIYDKTYKESWFIKKSSDWSSTWTLWGVWNTIDFEAKDCHLIACQTVERYSEPKTQCTVSEYFDILPN